MNSHTLRRSLAILIVMAWPCIHTAPELREDRIFPYDSALYAANGALFYSFVQELPSSLSSPLTWFEKYYQQYPSLAVRRHPPIFGIIESGVYSLTGISVFGAKLTSLLFSLIFVTGIYCMCFQFWRSDVLAFGVTILISTTPQVMSLMRSVWLDIPALAFAAWAFALYARWINGINRTLPWAIAIAFLMALTLYTYQLPAFLFCGVFVHMLIFERHSTLHNARFLASAAVFVVLMIPLILFTLFMAMDNVVGRKEWLVFAPIQDRMAFAYWTYYISRLFVAFPAQAFGLAMWILCWTWRRPSSSELLFVFCFVSAFSFFTWNPSKCDRYALYFVLPATVLTVIGIKVILDRVLCRMQTFGNICVVVVLLSVSVATVLCQDMPLGGEIAGMNEPVQAILGVEPRAKILYSGPRDAAFVFYVRAADPNRLARVYRTTVQLHDRDKIEDFVSSEEIDYIAVERNEGISHSPIHDRFQDAITRVVEQDKTLTLVNVFRLPCNNPRREGVTIDVYKRLLRKS